MNTVLLVPRRLDHGRRDEIWEWCKGWWEREQSHMPIIEGHHDVGQFNRSAALNTAARLAGPWDVAVIIDADVICDPQRVKDAVVIAHETGKMVLPHDVRYDLSDAGSRKVMAGYQGDWRGFVRKTYPDMVSAVVVMPRRLWDEMGGMDEAFSGWGYEDGAAAAAAETFGDGIVRMPGEVWHFWHPTAVEGRPGTETWQRNHARGQRYRAAIGDRDAIRALLAEGDAVGIPAEVMHIPPIFHRVVPEHTTAEVEGWWQRLQELHPGWRFMTHRDPLDPADWPETAASWRHCRNGASLADLVRLEALWRWGGLYLDSDVEPYRSFAPLLPLEAFAAWEDRNVVPNAVMGARPGHPAIRACLDLAKREVRRGTWEAGPGVTTKVLVGRDDVLLLPPGSFFPYHYSVKVERRHDDHAREQPWAFAAHHWAASWLKPAETPADSGPPRDGSRTSRGRALSPAASR